MMALRQTDLPDPVAPAMSRCGMSARSVTISAPATPEPRAIGRLRRPSASRYAADSSIPRSETTEVRAFGTSSPTTDLPGTGASMRSAGAASASARSCWSAVMRLTRTRVRDSSISLRRGWPSSSRMGLPSASRSSTVLVRTFQPGSTPNCVTAGPSLICVTAASTPNEASVSTMSCARRSLERVSDAAGSASRSRSIGGSCQPSLECRHAAASCSMSIGIWTAGRSGSSSSGSSPASAASRSAGSPAGAAAAAPAPFADATMRRARRASISAAFGTSDWPMRLTHAVSAAMA